MDSTYAPQSPDLSSFLSSPPKSQQPYQHQPTSQSASYAPRSPVIPSFNTQPHHNLHHQQYQSQPQNFGLGLGGGGGEFSEYGSASYMPPIPALPPQHSFGAPTTSPYLQQQFKNEHDYEYKPSFDADGDSDYIPSPTMSASTTRRGRPPSSSNMPPSTSFSSAQPQVQQSLKNPNPNNIEIKTKFPVARIKRIMQADEEVGKVAQVTPVAVSKALELFMIALVEGAASKAREKGGKRVTAQHLKAVVEGDEQFDFLSEIVGKVADVQEGAGGAKRKEKVEGSESEEEEKKHKKGKGRRKKSDD